MKKSVLLLVSLALIFGIFAAFPAASEESDLYYTNATILKVFPHSLGYYVIYRCPSSLKSAEFFIPKEWFSHKTMKAVLNLTDQNISPYLSIITNKGEFDHIRLTLPRKVTSSVWGTLSSGSAYNDKFNVETLTLEY